MIRHYPPKRQLLFNPGLAAKNNDTLRIFYPVEWRKSAKKTIIFMLPTKLENVINKSTKLIFLPKLVQK